MSSETNDEKPDVDPDEIVRPNLSMKGRQLLKLHKLSQSRYSSRSEAARAAIEAHAKSINEDGEAEIEQLASLVQEIAGQIDEIEDKLEEVQQLPKSTGEAVGQTKLLPETSEERSVRSIALNEVDHEEAALENEVFELLIDCEPVSLPEIVDHIEREALVVQGALNRLIQRDFVTTVDNGGRAKYRVKGVNERGEQ